MERPTEAKAAFKSLADRIPSWKGQSLY
jgi:hypothetical protein